MDVTVGTFNLNNLFSRYNFRGEIDAIKQGDTEVQVTYEFTDPTQYKIRTFKGRLVKVKDPKDTAAIVKRIEAMDVDVLAVQEVEDIDTLRRFAIDNLSGAYTHVVLVEGNDPRLIDVGILSKLPLGGVTSWQKAVHPGNLGRAVFGRDLLQVEILNPSRTKRLFTLFNTHLKSHYVSEDQDPLTGPVENNAIRQRQAEVALSIIKSQTRPNSAFIVTGDLNDPPDSAFLAPLVADASLPLVNALAAPVETRAPKADSPPPTSTAWTHRFKESGQPAHYALFDHIWLSQSLGAKQSGAWIDRRTKHSGDGSDHDPAWIQLTL